MKEAYIPPGHMGRQPEVKVSKATVAAMGEPTVDYDRLDSLFREELNVDYDVIPTLNLFGATRWGISGLHVPYTHSAYINAAKTVSHGQERLDEEVLRQAHYLAESVNSRLLTGLYLAGYPFNVGLGKLIAENEIHFADAIIPDSWTTVESTLHIASPLITTAAGLLIYNRWFDARRMGADDFTDDEEVFEQYKEIIVFPDTPKVEE